MEKNIYKTRGYAITGAHRTGKSTLCEDVAKELGIKYIPLNVSEIFKRNNISPKEVLSPAMRFSMQYEILLEGLNTWGNADEEGTPWITDRGPLDLIAYLINDSFTWGDDWWPEYNEYIHLCLGAQDEFFEKTFLMQPDGVLYDGDNPDKARGSRILQYNMNTVIHGLVSAYGVENVETIPFHYNKEEKRVLVYDDLLQRLYKED